MSEFRPKDRIRKSWNATVQFFRQARPQQKQGMIQQQSSSETAPWWRTKTAMITAGIVVIAAAAGIGGTQYVQANTVDYYNVYRDGTVVGSVSDPSEVEQLIAKQTEQVENSNPELRMVLDAGTITYTSESAFKAVPETEATLGKLAGMFNSHAVGVELKIDGKTVGIVKDQATADAILTRVQSKYAPQLASAKKKSGEVTTLSYSGAAAKASREDSAKNGVELKAVQFVEDVKTTDVSIDPSKIANADDLYKQLIQGSIQPTKYTVQQGDCIGCIAEKFDISPQVIYDNNRWIEEDKIKAGDVLDLTVLQPEITVKTIENVVETVKIEPQVEIQKNASMRAGETKTIREGTSGQKRLTYRIVKQNGYLVSEELVDSEVLVKAIPSIIVKGTKVILGEGTGKFAVPVSNWSLSSKYGQRWGRSHKGIDITGNKTIKASDNGVVTFVGTKNGYGNTVIIDHKNGYETLYGHLSSFDVKVGDIVEKGDKIAIMGSTGRSTGVHLHFEIHKNGSVQNPLTYL
ncbi:M23 family metallopeptidase [Paenibacillus radicis (ex Gao et al. 2016)]|uniref:Metalloendopeptidase n=1 Tax=Paenibacillus radicis (ex Gao et al. 2016) TaxID=1737354 RepID=A0A917H958_9BACL|nr:M23 family metallopeptidase [Paenibacillus radicis (ex Gao et al. 2016)]GGG71610.1 metalloendopeptidase [Paenibacillus radicis (ex Gao et al. 2016)]